MYNPVKPFSYTTVPSSMTEENNSSISVGKSCNNWSSMPTSNCIFEREVLNILGELLALLNSMKLPFRKGRRQRPSRMLH